MPEARIPLLQLLAAPVNRGAVLERLGTVIDPELGVNIVDLGLVFGAGIVDGAAEVLMTTTTPACPIWNYLSGQIRRALLGLDSVHDPRWAPKLMTDTAKAQLGWAR